MSKFLIENLDFCQSTRSAEIVGGAFGLVRIAVRSNVKVRARVRGLEATAGAAAAGAAAASLGETPLVSVSTDVS